MSSSISLEKHPEDRLARLLPGESALFRYQLTQWYLPEKPQIDFLVVAVADDRDRDVIKILLTSEVSEAEAILRDKIISLETMLELAALCRVPVIDLSQVQKLEPVSIAKPWGREIWFTGMEQRGLSQLGDGVYSVPLAWLIGLMPQTMMGDSAQSPNLLKILDPLPEPVFGDLYFELHEQKREVYVVTHVDRQAWPAGVGGIRYGFSSDQRQRFKDDEDFRSAYLAAVNAYRAIRRTIDDLIDELRTRDGLDLSEPVSSMQAKKWLEEIPAEVLEEEVALRGAMERFTDIRTLCQGDIVEVPLLMPHALQHGVRTVEFQTPVYERKILSFGQKVLTQQEWDTTEAVAMMSLEASENTGRGMVEETPAIMREQVVSFEDFEVQRVSLKNEEPWQVPKSDTYVLIMAVSGQVDIDDQSLGPEQAVFVPASCKPVCRRAVGAETGVILVLLPKSAAL